MGPDISIVIPAFNEERRLPATLNELLSELPRLCPADWEIVVSDDGSTDRTLAALEEFLESGSVRALSASSNQGKGAALLRGIRAARYGNVLLLDADLPVRVSTIVGMLEFDCAADLVIGSRRLAGSGFDPPQPLVRRLGGSAFRLAAQGLGYRASSDPQCGVKLLRVAALAPVLDSMRSDGFAFDVELIERSHRAGCRIVEVPVRWSHVEGSSLRPARDAIVTLRDLILLRGALRDAETPIPSAVR